MAVPQPAMNVRTFGNQRLIDVHVPLTLVAIGVSKALGLLTLGMLLGYALMRCLRAFSGVAQYVEGSEVLITLVIGLGSGGLLCLLRHQWSQQRWRRVLARLSAKFEGSDVDAAMLIKTLHALEHEEAARAELPPTHARRIANVLQAFRITGAVIRVLTEMGDGSDNRRLDQCGSYALAPFPFSFEPTKFKYATALYEQHDDESNPTRSPLLTAERWMLIGICGGLLVITTALMCYYLLGPMWAAGGVATLVMILLLVGFAVTMSFVEAAATRVTRRAGKEHFLVPGGMVEREHNLLANNAALHLFTRENANLIVVPASNEVLVTGGNPNPHRIACDRREQLALLSAWLSPAQPPTPAQLGDLAPVALRELSI